MVTESLSSCPACGGAGGGPMGRAGSAWDTEDYVCPRCEGEGTIRVGEVGEIGMPRPGIVKAAPPVVAIPARKRNAAG